MTRKEDLEFLPSASCTGRSDPGGRHNSGIQGLDIGRDLTSGGARKSNVYVIGCQGSTPRTGKRYV